MRGHLQARGSDSWRAKVYGGRSSDGRKRYVERTIRGTRREAETELARLVVEAGEGRYTASTPMTVDELLDRWLGVKRLSVEPTTVRSYSREVPAGLEIEIPKDVSFVRLIVSQIADEPIDLEFQFELGDRRYEYTVTDGDAPVGVPLEIPRDVRLCRIEVSAPSAQPCLEVDAVVIFGNAELRNFGMGNALQES